MINEEQVFSYEQDCGVVRVQAVNQGGADNGLLERVELALGVATRHLWRIRKHIVDLTPAVAREIEDSIERARALVGVGPASPFDV